jgi:hypothetical protein
MPTGTALGRGRSACQDPSLDGAIVAKVYGRGEEVLEPNWLSWSWAWGDRSRSAQLGALADAAELIADLRAMAPGAVLSESVRGNAVARGQDRQERRYCGRTIQTGQSGHFERRVSLTASPQ